MAKKADELRKSAREKLAKAEEFHIHESLSEEQQAEYEGLLSEAKALNQQADEADQAAERFAKQKAEHEELNRQAAIRNGTGPRPHSPIPATPKVEDKSHGFANIKEFLLATKNATFGRVDNRLDGLAAVGSDEHGTYSGPSGGFLVPETLLPRLLQVDSEADYITSLTEKITMQSPIVRIPAMADKDHSAGSVSGGLKFYWGAEADTVNATRAQFETVKLEANNLTGISFATNQLMQDSPISVMQLIESAFRKQYAATMLDVRINGDGKGKPLGILKSGALISVTKETGQAADTITLDNLTKMQSRAWRYNDSVWIANHDTRHQLQALTRQVGTGGTAVVLTDATMPGIDGMLLGRPIIFTEWAQKLGDEGDIILADWSQYLDGVYQQMQSASSMHVRFIYNEEAFRFTCRCDGQPWWRTALTPRYSSDTLSPFVTLAARA